MCAYICYTVYVNGHSVQWGENSFEIAFLQVNILEKIPFCSSRIEIFVRLLGESWLYWVKTETFFWQGGMKIRKIQWKKWKYSCRNIWPHYLVGFEDFCGHLRAEQSWVQSCLLMRYVGGHHGVNTFIEFCALSLKTTRNQTLWVWIYNSRYGGWKV